MVVLAGPPGASRIRDLPRREKRINPRQVESAVSFLALYNIIYLCELLIQVHSTSVCDMCDHMLPVRTYVARSLY